ncbi:MAG: DUF4136 domain-containing protein [Alphaproteobacteria bacterium]|nr:DUF4136 domain-containing protein [Alphaproteobacteria bacterium]
MKIFAIGLLLLIAGCNIQNHSTSSIEMENHLRNSGTYYIISSPNLTPQMENILDKNLIARDFIKLKDKNSQTTANYLVSINYKENGSHKTLQITILDNTSNNLKTVFLGKIIFKESNPLDNEEVLTCSINKLFENLAKNEDIKISHQHC